MQFRPNTDILKLFRKKEDGLTETTDFTKTVRHAYYTSLRSEDNRSREDCYLAANCTGAYLLAEPFTTYMPGGRNDFYLQYVQAGELHVVLDNGEAIMHGGDAIVYYPHTAYQYYVPKNAQKEVGVQYYWLHFTGFGALEMLRTCGIPNKTVLHIGTEHCLQQSFEHLFADFIARGACFELITASRILEICVELSRCACAQSGTTAVKDPRIYHAVAYIHNHYREHLYVETLARQQFLSVSRFRALFKETTGYAPAEYISLLRMGEARQLLAQSRLSVGEIAEAVGCTDRLYFSRLFKQKTGLSPAQYRRQTMQKNKESDKLRKE